MSDLNFTDMLLTGVINYGTPLLSLTLLLGGIGIPVPGTLLVVASGAFIRQEVLSLPYAFTLGLVGVVTGDSVSYAMGRFATRWVHHHFKGSDTWQKARETFNRWGGLTIYLTRFLLTPIALPTNLIAGSSHYPFGKFLVYDVAGEITWFLLYGGLGYLFGSQWELISQFLTDFSGLLVSLVILGAGIYFLWNSRERIANIVHET